MSVQGRGDNRIRACSPPITPSSTRTQQHPYINSYASMPRIKPDGNVHSTTSPPPIPRLLSHTNISHLRNQPPYYPSAHSHSHQHTHPAQHTHSLNRSFTFSYSTSRHRRVCMCHPRLTSQVQRRHLGHLRQCGNQSLGTINLEIVPWFMHASKGE